MAAGSSDAVRFPAICPYCGLIFATGFVGIEPGTKVNVGLMDVRHTCPRCREYANVVSGMFELVGNSITSVLEGEEYSRGTIEHLIEIVEQGRARGAEPGEVIEEISRAAPALALILQAVVPDDPVSFWPIMLVIVTAWLALIETAKLVRGERTITPEQQQQIIEKAIAGAIEQSAQLPPPPGAKFGTRDTHYQDCVIRVAELVGDRSPSVIEGFAFERCQITGPAVLVLQGVIAMTRCTFDADPDGFFWRLAPGQDKLMGAVVVKDCRFDDCVFVRIGIVDEDGTVRSHVEAS